MDVTGIGAVSDLIGTVVNKIWPDKSESDKQQLAAAVMIVQGQLDINKVEAASPTFWVSGARPFIMWVCGTAFAWNWIGLPVVKAALLLADIHLDVAPADMSEMSPILIGMLGLGGLRTVEKIKGVAAQ